MHGKSWISLEGDGALLECQQQTYSIVNGMFVEEDHGKSILEQLRGGLIVSCQASCDDSPTNNPEFLARMAAAVVRGGACGIRADGPLNIKAIRSEVPVPIIGIYKAVVPGYEVYITPTFEHAQAVVDAGADIVALDGTPRNRPGHENLATLVRRIQTELKVPVMLDISTFKEGIEVGNLEPDLISTTLSGYTEYSLKQEEPDLDLVASLALKQAVPVVAEGRIVSPRQVIDAFRAGAFTVVVGRAITDPELVTQRYVAEILRNKT